MAEQVDGVNFLSNAPGTRAEEVVLDDKASGIEQS